MIPDRLVSIHFPKAGGTSLRVQLATALGDSLRLDYDHDPLTERGMETAPFPPGMRAVHGHFRAARYAGASAFWLTFLREPIDNVLSVYLFWRVTPPHGNPVHDRFLAERPSVLGFAAYSSIRTLMSERYFGAFDMGRFDYIGLYEDRTADLRRLGRVLGVPLDPGLHENRTADGDQRAAMLDPPTRSRLRNLLRADIEFYDEVCRRRARAVHA